MQIEVYCFATLASRAPKDHYIEVDTPATPTTLMAQLGIAKEEVKLIFVNGKHANPEQLLHDKDRLALVPAVGGG